VQLAFFVQQLFVLAGRLCEFWECSREWGWLKTWLIKTLTLIGHIGYLFQQDLKALNRPNEHIIDNINTPLQVRQPLPLFPHQATDLLKLALNLANPLHKLPFLHPIPPNNLIKSQASLMYLLGLFNEDLLIIFV
jgi:hypothetical protein